MCKSVGPASPCHARMALVLALLCNMLIGMVMSGFLSYDRVVCETVNDSFEPLEVLVSSPTRAVGHFLIMTRLLQRLCDVPGHQYGYG